MIDRTISLGPDAKLIDGSALQAAIDSLAGEGGGTLQLSKGVFKLDRPLVMASRVSVLGAGPGQTILRNVRPQYAFRASSIVVPGNFHPAATQAWYGHSDSDGVFPVAKGATEVMLREPDRAAGYKAGDVVAFVDDRFTALQHYRVPYYVGLRRVVSAHAGTIVFDRPLGDACQGFVHNVSTTNIVAERIFDAELPRRIFVWCDASFGNLSVETQGYWIADSATLGVNFHDIDIIRARALHYGNTYQDTVFNRVGGRFSIKAVEFSHNCEDVRVSNWSGTYSPEPGLVSAEIVSIQESTIGAIVETGRLDVTGITAGPVLRAINANGNYRDLHITSAAGFTGNVIAIGDVFGRPGRRVSDGLAIERVEWNGPCGRYLNISGMIRNFRIDGCVFAGPVGTGEAFRVRSGSGTGAITNNDFQQGRGVLEPGVRGQSVKANYVHDGLTVAQAQTDVDAISGNGFRATALRERSGTDLGLPVWLSATAPVVLHSARFPAGSLVAGDRIAVSGNARFAACKVILRLTDCDSGARVDALAWASSGRSRSGLFKGELYFQPTGGIESINGDSREALPLFWQGRSWKVELIANPAGSAPTGRIEQFSLQLRNPQLR